MPARINVNLATKLQVDGEAIRRSRKFRSRATARLRNKGAARDGNPRETRGAQAGYWGTLRNVYAFGVLTSM